MPTMTHESGRPILHIILVVQSRLSVREIQLQLLLTDDLADCGARSMSAWANGTSAESVLQPNGLLPSHSETIARRNEEF